MLPRAEDISCIAGFPRKPPCFEASVGEGALRPGLNKILGAVDVVIVQRLDRRGRSTLDVRRTPKYERAEALRDAGRSGRDREKTALESDDRYVRTLAKAHCRKRLRFVSGNFSTRRAAGMRDYSKRSPPRCVDSPPGATPSTATASGHRPPQAPGHRALARLGRRP